MKVSELGAADSSVAVSVVRHERGDGRIEVGEHLVVEGELVESLVRVPPVVERLVGDLPCPLLVDELDGDLGLLRCHVVPHLAAHIQELGGIDAPSLIRVILVEDDLGERDTVANRPTHVQCGFFLLFGIVRGAVEHPVNKVGTLLGESAAAHRAQHAAHVVQSIFELDRFGHIGNLSTNGAVRHPFYRKCCCCCCC